MTSTLTSFHHLAFVYRTPDQFLEYIAPFVAQSVERREPMLIALSAEPLAALRSELGDRAEHVHWADTNEWHTNSSTRLRAFYEFVAEHRASGATRIGLVAEPVWREDQLDLVREWQRFESVSNRVLAGFPVTLVCTYDAGRLDPSIVASASRTHAWVVDNGPEEPSPAFEEPEELLRQWNVAPSSPPPHAAGLLPFADVVTARRFVRDQAAAAGLFPERTVDLLVAANEIVTNALTHAGGVTALAAWSEPGRFMCQVEDRGQGFADPLAGYRPPDRRSDGGRGLWLARQLVDLVEIMPTSAGTTVRLTVLRG